MISASAARASEASWTTAVTSAGIAPRIVIGRPPARDHILRLHTLLAHASLRADQGRPRRSRHPSARSSVVARRRAGGGGGPDKVWLSGDRDPDYRKRRAHRAGGGRHRR